MQLLKCYSLGVLSDTLITIGGFVLDRGITQSECKVS